MTNHVNKQDKALSVAESYRALLKAYESGDSCPNPNRTSIPLDEIKFATGALQPRTPDADYASLSKDHIDDLTESLLNSADCSLDPVMVWWSGQYWYCVDGHHRLSAYYALKNQVDRKTKRPLLPDNRAKNIPCTVFLGTPLEAMAMSLRENSKNKLSMSKKQKLDKAWHLTCIDQETFSKQKVADLCKVSPRTVATMRSKLKELVAMSYTINELSNYGWGDAKNLLMGERTINEEWEDALVERWARAFGKTFGSKLKTQPELAARAFERYFGKHQRNLKEFAIALAKTSGIEPEELDQDFEF